MFEINFTSFFSIIISSELSSLCSTNNMKSSVIYESVLYAGIFKTVLIAFVSYFIADINPKLLICMLIFDLCLSYQHFASFLMFIIHRHMDFIDLIGQHGHCLAETILFDYHCICNGSVRWQLCPNSECHFR